MRVAIAVLALGARHQPTVTPLRGSARIAAGRGATISIPRARTRLHGARRLTITAIVRGKVVERTTATLSTR